MASAHNNRGLSATKRAFSRPANLHLAWSTSKGVASPFRHSSESNRASLSLPTDNLPSFSAYSYLPSGLTSSTPPPKRSLSSHPYSSFSWRADEDDPTEATGRFYQSETDLRSSSADLGGSDPEDLEASVLRSGHLAWLNSDDHTTKPKSSSGFEKALRRRQATRERAAEKSKNYFVTLERRDSNDKNGHIFSSPWQNKDFSPRPYFPCEPFLASPGAADPSAFDIAGLPSLVPPPVPLSLGAQSRWVAPASWDSLRTTPMVASNSSSSSSSDHLQTPRSSQPSTPTDSGTFLNIYAQKSATSPPLMKLLITRDSTVEIRSLDGSTQTDSAQLVITGLLKSSPSSASSGFKPPYDSSDDSWAACILSSPSMAKLREWLYTIEEVIKQDQIGLSMHLASRRSSGSMLDTISQLEQLKIRRRSEQRVEIVDQHATPMTTSHSLPVLDHQPDVISSRSTCPDFSPCTFIDYYAANPDTALTAAESGTPAEESHVYDMEDAYASIMQRFSDYDLPSPQPLPALSSATLGADLFHRRSEYLDVPVSPCSIDFNQDAMFEEEARPGSPLDPWISQQHRPSVSSIDLREMDAYADDTVKMIFAEGFRRRSSTAP